MNKRIIYLATTGDTWYEVGVDGVELIHRLHEDFYRIEYKTKDVYVPFHAVQLYAAKEVQFYVIDEGGY